MFTLCCWLPISGNPLQWLRSINCICYFRSNVLKHTHDQRVFVQMVVSSVEIQISIVRITMHDGRRKFIIFVPYVYFVWITATHWPSRECSKQIKQIYYSCWSHTAFRKLLQNVPSYGMPCYATIIQMGIGDVQPFYGSARIQLGP